jgi:hypothetical protein
MEGTITAFPYWMMDHDMQCAAQGSKRFYKTARSIIIKCNVAKLLYSSRDEMLKLLIEPVHEENV